MKKCVNLFISKNFLSGVTNNIKKNVTSYLQIKRHKNVSKSVLNFMVL